MEQELIYVVISTIVGSSTGAGAVIYISKSVLEKQIEMYLNSEKAKLKIKDILRAECDIRHGTQNTDFKEFKDEIKDEIKNLYRLIERVSDRFFEKNI